LYVLPAVTLTVVCPHNVFIAFARFSEHGAWTVIMNTQVFFFFCAAETNLRIQKVKYPSHFISSILIYAIILLATVHFLTFWYTDILVHWYFIPTILHELAPFLNHRSKYENDNQKTVPDPILNNCVQIFIRKQATSTIFI
jgi:L-asparagine transporter-like permease